MDRRQVMIGMALAASLPDVARAGPSPADPADLLHTWYRLTLELIRHTPTYSPPVASRTLAYVGIAAFETLAQTDPALRSLAGQLGGLTPPPSPADTALIDPAAALEAALARTIGALFSNTGPTGQRALASLGGKLAQRATAGLPDRMAKASVAQGHAVADHILAWAATDGGAVIENMGFPLTYDLPKGPAYWVPANTVAVQQMPLLPHWGGNRPFAIPAGGCGLLAPQAYSEDPGSPMYREAVEVVETKANLTPDQRACARFWADDAMLSHTPPGHWIAIAMRILDAQGAGAARRAEVLALTGIATADAFTACWAAKFEWNTIRPVTYIRRTIDPAWEPLLNTPPFPEYPSGHSTQSAAAATVLTRCFGTDFAFTDDSQAADNLPARTFPSFRAAAEEAGISRLYGGIHFRTGIDRGLEQGDCVGAFAADLQTRTA